MSKTREMIITQTLSDLGVQIDLKTAPLVRCKDCKYFENSQCENCDVVTDLEGGAEIATWREEDDYCSYGERKETEHEHID